MWATKATRLSRNPSWTFLTHALHNTSINLIGGIRQHVFRRCSVHVRPLTLKKYCSSADLYIYRLPTYGNWFGGRKAVGSHRSTVDGATEGCERTHRCMYWYSASRRCSSMCSVHHFCGAAVASSEGGRWGEGGDVGWKLFLLLRWHHMLQHKSRNLWSQHVVANRDPDGESLDKCVGR